MKRFKFFKHDEDGSVAVEFAMIAVIFITSLLAIIEVGRAFWMYNTLEYAVEASARYYLTHRTMTNSEITTYVANQMGVNISTTPLTVTVTKTVVSGINQIEVDGDYTYSAIIPTMNSSWSSIVFHTKTRLPTS
jgi:Flp pilus assembly protein TadG